ncbi:hypothetical protein KXD40_007066 [Peronospora effusa]|uniref:Uncharacterized protein n=1 Tax=Peronospora effusa TaxID=542832 RepID=A0A3R7Y0Z1_9STRA|nr:hypothetical protein DD237_001691 [Peronospora effusa]UIZ25036.1 hypothetical protein KXD40_007066 [Peronospora effusa]
MVGSGLRHWLVHIFSACLKGRQDEGAYADRVHCMSKECTKKMASTPLSSIHISRVHLQPRVPVINDEPDAHDEVLWNKTNRLVNAAAAWQIRRVMPVDVATLDESVLSKMTTPELAKRFKAFPILMVLRSSNETLRRLPVSLLSRDAFVQLTLFERRAIHNVLATRPNGWTERQLSLYAERERELIAAADAQSSGQCDPLYTVQQSVVYSTYAPDLRD